MTDDAIIEMPAMNAAPVGPGSFPNRKDDGLFGLQDGIIALLPDWARKLYGIDGRAVRLRLARTVTRGMLAAARRSKSYDQVLRRRWPRPRRIPTADLEGEPGSSRHPGVEGDMPAVIYEAAAGRIPRTRPIPIRREKL